MSYLECILLATRSGEHAVPGPSCVLHEAVDGGEIPGLDMRAQCSGFLFAMQAADALIVAGRYRRVLVVGCEVHSTGLDKSTAGRDVSVIFGDGAKYVAETDERFEAVIIESPDPVGQARALFSTRFYRNVLRVLTSCGVAVRQAGATMVQGHELSYTTKRMRAACAHMAV